MAATSNIMAVARAPAAVVAGQHQPTRPLRAVVPPRRPADRRHARHVCHAEKDPDLLKKMGGKGIELQGFDDAHNPLAGAEFAAQLEERLTGFAAPDEPGLIGADGSKKSDALELAYDPDNLLGRVEDDLIARRQRQREAAEEDREKEDAKAAWEEERAKLLAMRAARVVPRDDPAALAQYFFDTEINEMEYECTRCKPQMTPEFFEYLLQQVDAAEDEKTKEKYRVLHKATKDFAMFLEANTAALAAPVERMKMILTAKDKKATILDMVGENAIDEPLIALLMTNINLAREGGQEDAAQFMEKVLMACRKYSGL
mmetsp:Transcript_31826/g.79690  ORF Transcript_31826/g.79690 Transcript_31826/m.79690 type:complete len:315 (-) Transcript_31826:291-1235(-)